MILVDIFVAALGRTFDFELDPEEPVGFLVRDIVELLQEEYGTKQNDDLDLQPHLYSCEQERMLPASETLTGCGIRTGYRMILC